MDSTVISALLYCILLFVFILFALQHHGSTNNNNDSQQQQQSPDDAVIDVLLHHVRRSLTAYYSQYYNKGSDYVSTSSFQQNQQQDSKIMSYQYMDSEQIHARLLAWASEYSQFVHLTTAQQAYGLPPATGAYSDDDDDCPFDENGGCLIYILTIQDFVVHPDGSESSKRLPEVIWNGELHGDERVGPTSVMEATELLLRAAACEASPRESIRNTTLNSSSEWEQELAFAKQCRADLAAELGDDDAGRRWLARLVTTRRIVVLPDANSVGYYRNERNELDKDINRDFPYNVETSKDCMQTIAARAINELFREHMFQMGLVFHAGIAVLGYEWGSEPWGGRPSPDDTSQSLIAAAQSRYGGTWPGEKPYPYGRIAEEVYAVRGGMEDWAYAGSWDTEHVIPCQPASFGGYPTNMTSYSNSTHRVFNMLVETSSEKVPRGELGTSVDVLNPEGAGSGHISRNIRLSLLAADLVEPYVWFTAVNEMNISSDIVPLLPRIDQSCRGKQILIEVSTMGNEQLQVHWRVGGALHVEQVDLWYAKWDDVPVSILDCLSQPSMADIQNLMQRGALLGPTNGTTQFSPSGESTIFRGTIDISSFLPDDEVVVLASARVDQSWAEQPFRSKPQIPPQSHIANVRTNPNWYHENERNIVQGRLDWFSQPLTVMISGSAVLQYIPTDAPTLRVMTKAPVLMDKKTDGPTRLRTQSPGGQSLSGSGTTEVPVLMTDKKSDRPTRLEPSFAPAHTSSNFPADLVHDPTSFPTQSDTQRPSQSTSAGEATSSGSTSESVSLVGVAILMWVLSRLPVG